MSEEGVISGPCWSHHWDNVAPHHIGPKKKPPEDVSCVNCGRPLLDYIQAEAAKLGQWPPAPENFGKLKDERKVIA